MRLSIRVDQQSARRVTRAIATLGAPRVHRPVSRFLLSAGMLLLDNAAHVQIIGGGRIKVGVGPRGGPVLEDAPPHPSKLTSRSGELRRSLSVDRGMDKSGLPRYVDVGTDKVYGPTHEFGLRGYRVRAFLAPAANAVQPRLEPLLIRELERELVAAGAR